MTTTLTTNTNSLIIIDSQVPDWQSLVGNVSPDTTILILDPTRDGISQIAELVANYSNLDAIHIISHGSAGSLLLGSSTLDSGNIADYASQLASIGNALSISGDILLYGCNVAQGDIGQQFIEQLGLLTGADIAASNDLTGNTSLGGDWVLEASAGIIESNSINPNVQYEYLLNASPTGSVSIIGTAIQGGTLTAINSLSDADGLGTITYQWQSNGIDIGGATSSTYTLSQAEVGKVMTVVAHYIDILGTPESVSSAATSAVANINDLPTGTVTITGSAIQGQTLTASNNLADLDGLGAITYQWKAGGVNINGANSSTYILTQAEVGKAITVTAHYTDGQGTAETVNSAATGTIANINDLPTGAVTITGTATQGQALTASNNLADLDGLGSITYQWQANGININGATSATYILTQAEVSKVMTVTAHYTDGQGTAETVSSTATGAVVNINDLPTGTVIITGITTQGQTLTASNNLADIDGLGIITYQWQAAGVDIGGATSATYTLTQADVGKVMTVLAHYTDGQNTAETVSSAATGVVANINDAPTGTVTITGIATQGQTLTVSNNLADADGLGVITYQWQAGGVDIGGATNATYVLTQAEVGKAITVTAHYTDGQGTAENVGSVATSVVANINDAPIGTVTITGIAAQGQTLTASNNLADADGLGAITYQWQAGGVNINGAIGATYVLTQAEVGKAITVAARYTDGQGTAETVGSAATSVIANVNDAPTGTVTITGTAIQGQTLTASNNLADADGLGPISYQWQANGLDISGATATTYTLSQVDVGKAITVFASYTDLGLTAERVGSAATGLVANVNDAPTGSVTIAGTATQGQTLTASNNLADIDGLGAITYQWQANGIAINGAIGTTYVLTQAEVGKAITVLAHYTDGQGTVENVSSGATGVVTNVNDAPTGTVTITGTAIQGQTLTVSNNLADADGLGAITYQWQAGGVDISGATATTYTLSQIDVGKAITVTAHYIDGQNTTENVSSAATSVVANINDAPTGTVTITGTAIQGQTLAASNNLADIDGLGAITYQWQAGGVNIGGATSATYVLTQAEVGKAITVIASYTDGQNTAETVSSGATNVVANVNDVPTGAVTITGTATQGQTLTVSNNLADADGLGAITYQWQANGIDISGATATTYTLSQVDVGKVMTVTAHYTDGQGTAETISSTATGAVANLNDLPTGTVTIAGTATQGQTLTASNNLADIDGLGIITYQWQAAGVDIGGATNATYTLTQADVGKVMTVLAHYTDGQNTAETVSSAATGVVANINDAPTGTVTITGIATQGQTLTVSNNLADADGLGVITYQWQAGGVDIGGATNATYVLTQAEVGKAITVTAHYTDGQGTAENVGSVATSVVANINDAPIGTVTITGIAAQGQTLTASNNLADADGLGAITYQWQAGGVNINGAIGATYVLTQAEVGKAITVAARYTDGQGTAETVSSAATGVIANVNDAPTGTVTITGTAIQGQTLTASNNLADADGLGPISYQWQANGLDISGATAATYTLSQVDVGKAITVFASYTDLGLTAERVGSAATGLVANVNDAPTGSVTIAGTATQGQTLTASNNLADIDGLGAITYQWQANGIAINGAIGTTYVLTQAEVGKAITVLAHYTDGQGTIENVSSGATGVVTNVNDAPTGTVTITGTAVQGQTLTVSNNLADVDGLGIITYQWQAAGVNINGATGTTYTLSQIDVGKAITVTAHYIDGQNTTENVSSAATSVVANINDAPTGTVTITGTAIQGQTLAASNNLADIDGLGAITYQWQAGGVNIGGATSATYVLTQAEVGKAITVIASYTDGQNTAETVSSGATNVVANVNDVPTGAVTITGTATQGQTLTVSNNLADADGLGAITYQWQANGIDISGATATTYTLSQVDVGKVMTVTAHYTDGQGTAETISSTATGAVANLNDLPTGTVTIAGTATQGQTLTASNNLADIDGLGIITYQWQAAGVDIGGATNATYTLTQADVGKVMTVLAHYTDGQNTAETVSSAATGVVANINDAPTGTVTITGIATQGQTLTVSNNLADADGLGVITYQWQAGGVDIGGATNATYVLTQAEVGKAITVTAHYTDGQGTAENVGSVATSVVANINDAPIGTVTITGIAAQGQTLTASNNLADADGLGAITYQWQAGGVNINGAIGATYVLTQAEVGKAITVAARYTDGQGTAETVGSAATSVIANVNDAPTGTVTITGTAIQGQTLTASNNLADADGLGPISYQWQANGLDISGATATTYTLSQVDVGKAITVFASYTDLGLTAERVGSAATGLVANVNDAPTGSVTIAGTATQGQTLTASNNLADIDGLGAITYQWQANGIAINGAIGTTYVLTQAEVGKAITVLAHYTDGQGTVENVSSGATGVVTNVNDAPTGTVTITGTAIQGQTLTVSNNLADADGLGAITYQWQAGGVDISGATATTYTLSQIDVGKAITVTAHYIDGQNTTENVSSAATSVVANINDAPTGTVTITGTAIQGQTLAASNNLADIDGLGAITYQWQAGGVNIGGATSATYVLTQAEVGKAITVIASYTDGQNTAETVSSGATNVVANVNDVPTGAVTITGTATQGQTLTVSNNLADADGLGAITYQWQANGIDISGATATTYTLSQVDVGKVMTVTAHYTDGQGTAETISSTATGAVANLNDLPTGTVTIAGTATQGQTLTASNNLADIDGLGIITYQWQAAGVDIGGATNATYTLTQADVGKVMTVLAHYTDGQNTAETVSSAATGVVANINDAPTGTVTITGIATQGQTLTVSNNLADADGLGVITYQWQAGGVDIGGATNATYVLTQAEVGKAITVTAHYTDGQGTAENVGSVATSVVANINDAPIGTVTITGIAAQGQTLTASNNLADADGLGAITYQWQAGGVNINGAIGATYVLTQAEVGKAITVAARYTDGQGTAETVGSAATSVIANVNDAPTGTVTITGTAIQGQTLTASNNLADADGLGPISYQWQANGLDISGATATTYTLSQVDVGKAITVFASYTDLGLTAERVGSAATGLVANVNDAPTGSVTIAGTATQGQTLTASNNLADIDGLGAITYQWQANGIAINGAIGTTYVLTQAEVGKAITVLAHYTDGQGTVENVSSGATGVVTNVNDAPTGTVTITGTAIQGQTLTVSNNLADADGLGAITYQWQAGGVDISGATATTYTLSQIDVGKAITVTAHYIDGQNTTENVSSAATSVVANINDAPTGTVTITGTAIQGQTLAASNNLADIDGLGAITYQWQAGGVNIGGATSATYVLTQAEVGKAITVIASYTDGQNTAETVSSGATNVVANVNDVPTGAVTITGTATQGQTLTVSNNLADADGLGAITYQWQANGIDISGATATTYTLSQVDVGKVMTVTAHYTDGQGTAETISSTATGAVANLNDLPTGTVTIAGTATQGQTLTASNNLADIDGLGIITYQWQAAGVDIGGATNATYTLTQADVGKVMTVLAHYTDGQNTAETVSSAAAGVVANINDAPTGTVTITGIATQGQTLTVSNNLADADGLGVITYQWQAGGVDIGGATNATYVLTQAEVGKAITVTAHYTDGQGTAENVGSVATSVVANINDAPTGTVTITGIAAQGQTLTASNNLADADGLGAITYQWQAGGVNINGAIGATYVLTQAEVGKAITVAARYTDGQGTAETVSSAATGVIANVNDAPTGTVTITGTAIQGQTLTASNNLADADGLGPISYQWQANGLDISGATAATYTLSQVDVGKAITVFASYTDLGLTAERVGSAATGLVANVNDAPTGSVTIAGTATQGQTLTASNNLADIDGLGAITYQWQANGIAINGAIGTTYVLTQAEVGKAITVLAHYTDGQGTIENVSSGATGVVTNVNDAPTGTVTITGTAVQGQTLTVSNNLADVDGLGIITYQWQAAGVNINGATGTTYTLSQIDVGKAITVTAHYIDGQNTTENVSSAATSVVANINDAPTGTVTITGTAIQGQTLAASNNLADIDGLGAITYQWQAGGVNIGGATSATYVLTQAEVGKAITVIASYTDGQNTAETVSSGATNVVANVNDVPTGAVTITGTATQGQTLTVSNNLADADGLGAITYQWQANGVNINGAIGTTYVLTQAEVGKAITVAAHYTDGQGTAETVNSVATSAVANLNDLPTGTVTITGTATQGQTLTASNNLADVDGLGIIAYQWQADGVNIGGATSATYTLSQADVGKAMTVFAHYIDGQGTAESVSSTATGVVANINDAPTGTVTITGIATQGQTLTVSNNLADADGLGVITYQWQAGGVDIGGATNATYVLTQAEVGKAITVTAHYTDGQGTAENVNSVATGVVANINDAPTGTVTITGTAAQGQTLTASNNLADADGLGAITYQWQAGGVNINGAIGATYVLTQAEVGKAITVAARYTDGQGTAETVSSAATSVIANVNDAPTGTVIISGVATQGRTLTASNNLADADGLGPISYQWQANGLDISGATAATYTLSQVDVGKAITVFASYTDLGLTAERVGSAATGLVANVNDAPTGSVTIAGTATQGQTLTASNNLADIDGLGAITYQWQANGIAINGAIGTTYVLTQAEVGKAITVLAHYTDGQGTIENVSSGATGVVTNVNDAPTGTVTITGTAVQGQTLTVSNNLADVDGLGIITYQWQAAGVNINGATGTTYTLSQIDVGKAITVTAHYIDGQNTTENVSSAATSVVANINDAPTGTVTITGTAIQGQTLAASNNLADIDGLGAITYQWQAGGVNIGGATSATYVLTQAEVGKAITVIASYTDGQNTAETVSSGATNVVANVNDVPTGAVTITGTATQGQTLTVSNNLADADGLGAITYQWQANGVNINGAIGTTYVLTQAEVGKAITVAAHYTDGQGTAETVNSVATSAVANLNDLPTGTVTITGTATQGQTLTASNNLADVDGLGIIAYQWQADGVNIGGATSATYTLSQADVGKAMTVFAHYIDGQGTAESVSSTATGVVANINDAPTGTVTITGIATQGQTLTVSNNLADADGLGVITYQWQAGGVDIGGATNATYVLTQAEVGKVMTVLARYTDGQGTAESVGSATTAAVANINDAPTGAVTITGTEAQGQTLTASNNLADADGLGAITYQWQAGGVNINGATSTTYTLTQAEVGKVMTVTAHYTDGQGTAETVSSAATGVIANVNDAPVLTTPTTINYIDTAFIDNFITVTSSLVASDVDPGTTLTYGILGGVPGIIPGTVTANNIYGVLTVTTATGAYTFVPNSAAIEPLGVDINNALIAKVTVSDGLLTDSKDFTVTITQQGVTETNGNDTLTGTVGADSWAGLAGNDTYFVNNVGDLILENVGEGTDTVSSTVSYTLSNNIENLILTGTTAINGAGNSLNNQLTGNSADNILSGGAGVDTMIGGLGNDTYGVDDSSDVVIENAGEGTDTVSSRASSYTLSANVENLLLTGTAAINGTGNNLNNQLTGNSANNVLDGGLGADTMLGGLGDDTYTVDNTGDVVTENAGEGTDTVNSSLLSYDLTANLENLILTSGSAAINGGGNSLDNQLTGNNADNLLSGGGGVDTMTGGLGNDTYGVDNASDVVVENAGEGIDTVSSRSTAYTLAANVENLILTGTVAINGAGNTLNNQLTGNSADNILSGGAGVDTMIGGLGNDTYGVDNSSDVVIENAGEGTDTVSSRASSYTLSANVENLLLTGTAAINGFGNTLNNQLTGNSANNILDGGLGADTMLGGLGDDAYTVDNIGDVVTENAGEGTDTVNSSLLSYTLTTNVENLTLTGNAAINGGGNALNNILIGNSADNVLSGGGGIDTMIGGLGNDSYTVDNNSDVVIENAGEGTDTVASRASSYTLAANVENLILNGTAAIDGTGNAQDNQITGNSANNTLAGGDGADIIIGGLGKDTYNLTETAPKTDTLTIATGDSLVSNYDVANSFTLGTGINQAGVDRLDLSSTLIAGNGIGDGADVGIGADAISSHSITNGIISFDSLGGYDTPVAVTTATNLANVLTYLQANITGGNTVAFVADTNNTYVFQDGGATDTLVELVGVTATSVNNTGLTANSVWII